MNLRTRADDVRAACPLFQGDRGGSTPTSALEIRVEEIDARTAVKLNALWHSVLPHVDLGTILGGYHSVSYAANVGGVFYAVAIWSDPVNPQLAGTRERIELRRFAIAPDAPPNSASRMLAVMKRLVGRKFPDIRILMSYQAVATHAGTIYRAAGWQPVHTGKHNPWGTRKRRKRAAGFRVAPSTRKAAQIVSDKVRWECYVNGGSLEKAKPPFVKPSPVSVESSHGSLFSGEAPAALPSPQSPALTEGSVTP